MKWPFSKRSRLQLLPITCVFILVILLITQNSLNKKNMRVAYAIIRLKHPVDISNNEGNQTYNPVPARTESTTKCDSSSSSARLIQHETKSKNLQDDKNMQMEDIVDDKFLLEREEVYRERRDRVNEVCDKLGTTVSFGSVKRAPLYRLRWLNSHRLIMCFNAKVGTSSWSLHLLNIARPEIPRERLKRFKHQMAQSLLIPTNDRRSDASVALMKEFGKIMIVRHPFARIVSAYVDKIASLEFRNTADRIVKFYRSPSSTSKARIPTFEEFVRYLVHVTPAVDDVRRKAAGVTNIHWMPFYVNCAPCDIHYDIILKMESIEDDTRYVNHRFGLGLKKDVWKHRAANSSEVTAHTFFKALPSDLILKLYKRFHVDFDMYGYSVAPFLAET